MKTITYYVLCIMGTLVFVLPLILNTFPITLVSAAESTPSAETKSKLKALQEQIASQASKIKLDITRKMQNRAFNGFIKSKSPTSLTLATKSGSKIINLNEYTNYQSTGKLKTGLSNLTTDDFIIALGDVDNNEVLTAKVIIKTASPSAQQRKAIFGQVLSVNNEVVVITDKEKQKFTVKTNSETTYKIGKEVGALSDIKAGKPIIVSGPTDNTGTIEARFIYIYPYSSIAKPKIASPSTTATGSAEKKK